MTQALGILILLAVAAGAGYVVFRPHFALVLVMTLFPVKQLLQAYLPAFTVNSSLFNMIIFGVVLLAVIARVLRRDGAFAGYFNRVTLTIWLLYGFAVFGLLYTPARENATDLVLDGAPYWLMMVALLPFVLVRVEDIQKVLPAFMLVGTVVCVLMIVNPSTQFYKGRLVIDIGQSIGVGDLYGSPLITATMGAQVAIVAALFRPIRPSAFYNVLRIGALITGTGLAVMSGSRGNAVFAVMVVLMCYPLARRVADMRQFMMTTGAFGVLAGGMLVAFRFFLGRDSTQGERWDISKWNEPILERFIPISRVLDAYLASPSRWPFGLGTNAYSAVLNMPRGYSHNLIFELLCEHGFVGLGLFGIAALFAFRAGRNLWRLHADDPPRRAAVATLLALCIYAIMLQMKEGTFVGLPTVWFIWAIMAKISVYEMKSARALTNQESWEAEYGEEEAAYDDGYGTYAEGYDNDGGPAGGRLALGDAG